ncbi:hypothetical protein CLOP_g2559, partial [Closterium sp. NIES-67]
LIRTGEWSKLTIDLCKAYLRHHGLRLSDPKAELINRIQKHAELRDFTSAKRKYPRGSFCINCTGDVCRQDTVLFKQQIPQKHNNESNYPGYRLVAGRVVKESYGVKKQQHTFTVEVIWSSGMQPLPPMTQLLVKGRVLYRHKTYRQKWPNEAERVAAVVEKHARGDEARSVRLKRLENKPSGRRLESKQKRRALGKWPSTRRGPQGLSSRPLPVSSRRGKRPRSGTGWSAGYKQAKKRKV